MKETFFDRWKLSASAPIHELLDQLQERAALGRLEETWDEAEYQEVLHLLEDEEQRIVHRFFSSPP